MDIVIATSNQNKLKEFKALLKGCAVTILSLKDFPRIPPIVEDGKSFYENALKKATTVVHHTGKFTIADDSGLEVEYLGGASILLVLRERMPMTKKTMPGC